MANFTGAECLICKEKFTGNDDIVVCPECGTPYHRECYAKEGRCINDELHEAKISWSEKKEQDEKGKPIVCEKCGAENKSHAFLCQQCGASLVGDINFENTSDNNNGRQGQNKGVFTFNINDKYCGMNPEEEIAENVKTSEAADFIGTNVPYYLMLFKRMKDTGKKISICAISLLFPQFYFANRKMWKEAVLTTFIETLLSIPYAIYSLISAGIYLEENGAGNELSSKLAAISINEVWLNIAVTATNYISMIIPILAFLFANWLYYRHMQKKINKIKSRYSSQEEISVRIATAGGTSILGIFLMLALQFILSMILVLGLMYIYM